MTWDGLVLLPLNRGAQEGKMSGVFVHDNYYYFFIVITTFVYIQDTGICGLTEEKGGCPTINQNPITLPLSPRRRQRERMRQ